MRLKGRRLGAAATAAVGLQGVVVSGGGAGGGGGGGGMQIV